MANEKDVKSDTGKPVYVLFPRDATAREILNIMRKMKAELMARKKEETKD